MSPLDDFAKGITVLNFSICPFVQRVTTVLHSYNIHFDSYDHLIAMVSKIKQKSLDTKTLQNLRDVAKKNSLLVG